MNAAILLLLGLGLVEGEGRCFFNRTEEHCVCHSLSQESLSSIIQCLPASVVEFWGGDLERYAALTISDLQPSVIDMLETLNIRKLVFGDLLVPEVLLAQVLKFFSYTQVQELVFESCNFVGRSNWTEMAGQNLPILNLRFHNVTSAPLTGHEQGFSSLSGWLETLQELAVTSSHVTALPCAIGRVFRGLRSLDVAQNSLRDESLMPAFCEGAFPQLQLLSLQRNNLTSYHSVCESLQLLHELQHLDLSENKLIAGLASSCQWPMSLRVFNLSGTGLDEVLTPLPPNLEVLDMSCNHLRTLDISLASLKMLFLSQNMLRDVSFVRNFPRLEILHLDYNLIPELPWDELRILGHLRDVTAAGNPYNCSCSGAAGIQMLAGMVHLGPGWPRDYVCHSPPRYQGVLVKDVPVSVLQCNSAAVITPICVILALLCVAGAVYLAQSRSGLFQACRRAVKGS
ncbi:monocyte differentiation antigen CD14 isoform X2 [Struthio camelus]|nr:PREDICTED: monocyte differentiation antigen CD14 isoform X2 [Struthio camelus australis]XP_009683045.1 PREDICTED: monocyte differentiation antigen CD14 isoform X2 [Struthio camelus australis]